MSRTFGVAEGFDMWKPEKECARGRAATPKTTRQERACRLWQSEAGGMGSHRDLVNRFTDFAVQSEKTGKSRWEVLS